MSKGIFVTGEVLSLSSKSQQCTVIPADESKQVKPPYSFPLINGTISIRSNDTLFKALHPDKEINKKNIMNFISNPQLKKSYSCNNMISDKPKKEDFLTSEFDEYYRLKKLKELAKIFKVNKNPYSMKNQLYFKKQKIEEMQKRSNYYNKVIIPNKNVFSINNTTEYKESDTFETTDIINEIVELKPNEFKRKVPTMKDYLKKKYDLLRTMDNKVHFSPPEPNTASLVKTPLNSTITLNENQKRLYVKSPPKVKMTPTYVRDLKILAAFNKIKDEKLVSYLKMILHDYN